MHILPVAGSASRFGGIPKYLLPSNRDGKSLLRAHIDAAMAIDAGRVIVMAHPTMHDYLTDYLSDYSSQLVVDQIESRTMTETILQATIRYSFPGDLISITLPDTATTSSIKNEFSSFLEECRTKGNCLMLYPYLAEYAGKFGQVLVSEENNEVLDIIDKSLNCNYPFIWGGISLNYETVTNFDPNEQTIGNCIKKSLDERKTFYGVISNDRYFDCGNMEDYLDYLSTL